VGLTPPDYIPIEAHKWLSPFWDFYETKCAEIGQVDALVLNGDMVDGPGKRDNKLHITTNMRKQTKMAADVLVRSHVHYCASASVADQKRGIMRHAITTPAMQLRGPVEGSFVRGLRTWLYHVGMLLIEISEETGETLLRPIIFPINSYMQRRYKCLTKTAQN
jgi:hypothetical protein